MKPTRLTLLLIFVVSALLLSYLPKPNSASASESWRVPVDQPLLVQEFRQPSADWSAGHRGVDYLVLQDQAVYAPHDGVISFAGAVVNRQLVSIRHSNGMITSIEPVCPIKKTDEWVQSGERIGTVCARADYVSHCAPRICLHFSLRTPGGYLSPLVVLGELSPSRLKPWDGQTCSLPSGAQC